MPSRWLKLNERQSRFVERYIITLNATQAALDAGYSPKTAYSHGQRLLKHVEVKKAIAALQEEVSKRNEITVGRIVREYAAIAFMKTTDAIYIKDGHAYVENTDDLTDEQRAAISEIQETKDGIRIKFHPKVSALDALSKHLGMSSGNFNVEHSGETKFAIVAPDPNQWREILADDASDSDFPVLAQPADD